MHTIRKAIQTIQARFLSFGYRLDVTSQVIRHVAKAVNSGLHPGGADAAIRWIADACALALTRLLDEGAP